MRGLTAEEYALLTGTDVPCDGECVDVSAREEDVYDDLIEQGRVTEGNCFRCGSVGVFHVTSSGRSALALYPLMLALQAQP